MRQLGKAKVRMGSKKRGVRRSMAGDVVDVFVLAPRRMFFFDSSCMHLSSRCKDTGVWRYMTINVDMTVICWDTLYVWSIIHPRHRKSASTTCTSRNLASRPSHTAVIIIRVELNPNRYSLI